MAYNYAPLAATAKRLVEQFGRPVEFFRKSETPADPDKPWRGSVSPDTRVQLIAVLVDYTLEEATSDHVLRGDKRAFVAQLSIPGIDLTDFDRMVDADGQTWSVVRIETINPGDTRLLYDVQLRQ